MVNYLFGNGFSISVNPDFNYSKLLRGFIKKFESEHHMILPPIVETNPEVFFSKMITSRKLKEKKYMTLLFVIQQKLKRYLIERIERAPDPMKEYKAEDLIEGESAIATTNYDLNVEKVFSIGYVDHLHGRIDDPQSIIFAAAEAKKLVQGDIKFFIKKLEGEVRVFGLKPGYDKHIWNGLISNKSISKIVFSYYEGSREEKTFAENYVKRDSKLQCLASNEFSEKYFK